MKAVGIILAGGNSEMRLGDLTAFRAAAAMPVGGSYRAIDFPLTSMTASGIGKIAVGLRKKKRWTFRFFTLYKHG